MAKNDKKKVQSRADEARNTGLNLTSNLREGMINPTTSDMYNNYNAASQTAFDDYRNIMDQYRNFQASPSVQPYQYERVNYNRSPEMQNALNSYQNFVNTGGFSNADIADMRARGISPIRAVYANSMNELARQKNLQGGYAPNMAAAINRMRSGTSQQIADQVQNVNAYLAEQVQKGKQFGTQGLGGLATNDAELAMRAALANQGAGLQAAQLNANNIDPMRLAAIQGQAQLYGTTPGMANMFGNQVLESTRNAMQNNQQALDVGQQGFNNQMQVATVPSNFQTAMGRIGTGIDYGARIAGAIGGLPVRPPQTNVAMQTYNQLPTTNPLLPSRRV